MLEIIQWVCLVLLGGIVGWVWKDRSTHATPDWVSGIDEEDLVTQSDLDQYHHRVVQLSHAQRELLLKKIDVIEHRVKELQTLPELRKTHSTPESPQAERCALDASALQVLPEIEEPQRTLPSQTEGMDSENAENLATDPEVCLDEKFEVRSDNSLPSDPTIRVVQLWREGKPIEQIARELRMGRQEVQLLIEMSRHAPVGAHKG